MLRIIEGIYTIQGLRVGRVYLIKGENGLTLIDASLPHCQRVIAQQLQNQGLRLEDVKQILITHAHPDHIGGLAELQQATGAQVYAHRLDAPSIRGEQPLSVPPAEKQTLMNRLMSVGAYTLPPPKPAPVDHALEGGETLDRVLPGLQVIGLPGHTPGSVGYWLPEQRLLFCGDVLMRMGGRMRTPFATVTVDMAEEKRSVRKIADMNVDILCMGHGAPYIGGAAAVINTFARQIGL